MVKGEVIISDKRTVSMSKIKEGSFDWYWNVERLNFSTLENLKLLVFQKKFFEFIFVGSCKDY